MFTRAMFETHDIKAQGRLLSQISALVDNGQLRSSLGKNMGELNAENLIKAHAEVESGKTIGKIALTVPQ